MKGVLIFILFIVCTYACTPSPSGSALFGTTSGTWAATLSGINPGNTVIVACVSSGLVSNRPIGLTQVAFLPLTGNQKFSVFYAISQSSSLSWTLPTSGGQTLCVAQAYSGVRFTGLAGVANSALAGPPIDWSGLALSVGGIIGTGLGAPTNTGATSVQSGTTADQTLAIALGSFPGYAAGAATSPFVVSSTTTSATFSATLIFDAC